ncbi:MAG: TonB-dependent receptor [Chitinophagaceae bacterium]
MRKILQLQKSIISFIILLCSFSFVQAQSGTIKGVVRDERGPLAGASVTISNNKGTITNENGEYELKVAPGKYTVTYSYAGYQLYTTKANVTANETAMSDATLVSSVTGEEIVVLGSRSSGRSKLVSAVPVDVIPVSQVINDIGQVDLNQILTYIAPSFQSARQTIADGTDHVDPAQLRGLGTDQILVLINGKRRHQSALVNVNGTVNRGQVSTDMSSIPATAIERIEILRDGAAAQYGSDAIAGVINIVLKKKTGLLEAGVSYGKYITEYEKNYAIFKLAGKSDDPEVKVRDGGNFQASLSYGFNLGKGYLNLTGEYISREPTNRAGTYTGRIFPLVGGVNKDDSILQARNLSRNSFDLKIGNSKMKGGNIFYNFGYPLSDKTELYLFGGYGKKEGTSAGFYRYPDGATSILSGARKYAPDVLALFPNGFLPQINSDLLDFSTAAGLRTKFNGWNFDISNTYGLNKFDFTIDESVNYTQFAIPGNRQTSFDAGGLKFWQNTVNADISKKYGSLNIAGGLEYRVDAFGIRSGEEASFKNFDTASKASAGAQVFSGFRNMIGDTKTRNSKAIYTDLEYDVTKSFLVTGALRFENYSDFGSTLNYKVSSRYKFSDAFTLRGSLSTGFRAPSMQQRFFSKTSTIFQSQGGTLVQVESGTFTNDSKAAQILGIPTLKEETSHSYSVGFTAKPFSGFEATVDAYQVNIKDRIVLTNDFPSSTFTNAALRAQLAAAGASTANFFTNAVDTKSKGLEAVLSYNKNFAKKQSLRTVLAMTFIDNEVKKGADGKPIIHASDTLIANGQLKNYFNREDQSRVEVASPKSKISLTFNYKISKLGAMLRFVRFGKVQYIDPGIDPNNPAAFPMNAFNNNNRETTDQLFSEKTVTDLSLSYQITSQLGFTVGANNLLDVYQDRHQHSSNMSSGRFVYSRRVQQMGFNGAYYFARLKLNLDTKK